MVRGDNSLFFATGLDNSGLKQGAFDATNIISSLASSISSINPFAALAVGAVAAFTTIAKSAYEMSSNFQQAMKEVETISDATQKDFDGISQSVFDITKITPDNPEKIAKAYYQIVSAGYDGAEGLELLEVAAKSAVAGVTDTATAADGITTILNAFKLKAEESENVADSLFNTVKLGKTTFGELASSLSQVAPIAAASDIPLNEILATVASLTKQGVPTAQAATQIRAAIVGLQKAGSLDGSRTFQENMQSLYDTVEGNQTVLLKEVGSIEAVQAILAVAGKNAQSAKADLESYNGVIGATEEAFERMASSNVNQWAILGNRIKATTKGIGDAAVEMTSGMAKALNSLFEESNKLSTEFEKQADKINELYVEYTELTTEEGRRIEILKELEKINPSIVDGIDDQTDAYDKLSDSIRKYNNYVLNKKLIDEEYSTSLNSYEGAIENQKKAQNKYLKSLNLEYLDFIKNLSNLEVTGDQKKAIDNIIGSEGDWLTKTKEIRGYLYQINGNRQSKVDLPFDDLEKYREQTELVVDLQNRLDEKLKNRDKDLFLLQDNEDSSVGVIAEINAINSLTELSKKYGDYQSKSIKTAFEERKKYLIQLEDTKKVIEEINNVTKEQYKGNSQILKSYLESDNQAIKEAAEKRLKYLTSTTGGSASGGEGDSYAKTLEEKSKKYKEYEDYVSQLGKEAADRRYKTLLSEGENYSKFLQNELSKTKDFEKEKDIVQAASKSGVKLLDNATVEKLNIKTQPINLSIEIEEDSIESIQNKIKKLTEDFEKANTDGRREVLANQIKIESKKLQAAQRFLNKEESLYDNLHRSISDLKNKELREYIKLWQDKLAVAQKGSAAAAEAEGNIQNATEQIGQNTADTIGQIVGLMNEASSIFRKFGDEDMAQLLDQLSGVASGIGTIASSGGNPLAIAQGALEVFNSALTVEVVSDTAKFEAAIKSLEKAIDKLDYVISQSIGGEKVSSRVSAIKDLKELEEQANKAQEAELAARKETKLLGITIGKKGKGSGTDASKLEELEEKAENARRKAEELRNELNEIYTGATSQSLADSIIEGFKEGKRSAEDFADSFEELMKNAIFESLKIKYLEKASNDFFEKFGALSGDADGLTASDITSLSGMADSFFTKSIEELNAVNKILEEAGIAGGVLEEAKKTGLSGAISTITEDTANILSGILNSIRIDVANAISIAQQSSLFLAQIAQNTSYNKYLETMAIDIKELRSSMQNFEAKGF